jgi:hypothetical protein
MPTQRDQPSPEEIRAEREKIRAESDEDKQLERSRKSESLMIPRGARSSTAISRRGPLILKGNQ